VNDKELADRVVALGVGYTEIFPPARTTFYFHESIGMPMDAGEFLEKWDIAGALMEKIPIASGETPLLLVMAKAITIPEKENESLPRAVIEVSRRLMVVSGETPLLLVMAKAITIPEKENESLPRAVIEACCEALS